MTKDSAMNCPNPTFTAGHGASKKQAGFTLIEGMAVVLIISLLAIIAIPIYQNYLRRSQFSEGLVLATSFKQSINEYLVREGALPTCNAQLGVASATDHSGEYVERVDVLPADCNLPPNSDPQAGWVQVSYRVPPFAAGENTLVLTPVVNNNQIRWNCTTNTTVPSRFRPIACK